MEAQMGSENLIIPGITKNGVVEHRSDTLLPDGLQVAILVRPADVTPETSGRMGPVGQGERRGMGHD